MTTKIIPAILVMLAPMNSATAEDPVSFADARLKAAVEEALWISDPTPTDMLGLTQLVCPRIKTGDDGIEDLTGIEYAANLQTLNLRYHLVGDLSPLSGLTNLQTLNLHGNLRIRDLSPLSGLSRLRTLNLIRNDIHGISPLSRLTNLTWLSLHRNHISDISSLSGLTALGFLDLRINPLNNDAYTTYLEQITVNNPGIELLYDSFSHRRLLIDSTVGGSVADPGEGAFTYEHGTFVWLVAEADPGFAFVRFSGNYSTSQNPTLLTMDQDYEIWASFASVLDTIHVDGGRTDGPGSGNSGDENGTPEYPFDRIQEAINVATDGACIIVRPGTYIENIDFGGKHIRLTGIDPDDPNRMAFPVIQGAGEGPVVSFTRGEDPNCMLAGFVLTGGQGSRAGAILCSRSSPTIANCLIVGNRAGDPNGAAVYCTDSNAVFVNCTVADNYGGERGGGFHVADSNIALVNSIVWGNMPSAIVVSGEGRALVSYSDVSGGWSGPGNLDVDPLFARHSYWADPGDPGIVLGPDEDKAVWIAGDYHLKSQTGRWDPEARSWGPDDVTSPCIDAGDPLDPVGPESPPNGGIINMGAYGGTTEASKSL